MDHALPIKLRLAVVTLRDEEHTYEEIASLLGIGRATVSRLLRRRRETGKLERLPRGGGVVSPIRGPVAELLCSIVGEMNDATLEELTKALIERADVKTSRAGVVRAMARLGFTRKKSHWLRASATRPSTAIGARSTVRSSRR
jgi:transposase